jgi:hypothetical protein
MSIVDTRTPTRVRIIPIGDERWRITRPDGEVLGYIDRSPAAAGDRFHARRMLVLQRRFLPVGDFWSLEDAVEALS